MLDLGNSKSGDLECVHNLSDLARLLLDWINVRGSCNFKWLRVAETAHPTNIARLIGVDLCSVAWCKSISCEEKYPRHIQANWFALFVKTTLSCVMGGVDVTRRIRVPAGQ